MNLDKNENSDFLILPKQFYYPVSNRYSKSLLMKKAENYLTPENFMEFVRTSVTDET